MHHGGKINIIIIIIIRIKQLFCIVFLFRPTDDGTKMEAPGALVNAALDYGVTHVINFGIFCIKVNICFSFY